MWSINEPALAPWTTDPIVPDEVLYEFDGPLTFTASFGLFSAFFHNIGQRGNSSFFAVVQISTEALDALRRGALSVRGALNSPNIWILDLGRNFSVQRYWSCEQEDFPEKLLPKRNVPIHAGMDLAPDSLEEANAYFSIAFTGEKLKRKSIPFNILKSLIDDSYEAARRILSPAYMAGAKSGTFDFPARAIPGSLILTLDQPTINEVYLRKRTIDAPLSVDDAQVSFEKQRDIFLGDTATLVAQASGGKLSDDLAEQHFALLNNLQKIIPSDDNKIEGVVFTARSGEATTSVAVNERAGTTMHRAFKRIERRSVTDIGRIEIVNASSETFVYRSSRERQVTCSVSHETFKRLEATGNLRHGSIVRVKGHITTRQKRDAMIVEEVIALVPPPPPTIPQ
ncbi:hypothetical protein AB8A28_19865 [Tardiphaga sp. 71_E8_N1_1]|uniref:hypothetical protein n=1 Tax=Tardiphaga sp. 71_E8_N1_1 TaxID=3240784 RepID=UPI003F8C8277